jgi:hypothetical protein
MGGLAEKRECGAHLSSWAGRERRQGLLQTQEQPKIAGQHTSPNRRRDRRGVQGFGCERSFLIDTDLLLTFIQKPGVAISMSLTAANVSRRITYRNPKGGVEVFTTANHAFVHPNEPVLVDITLYRDPDVTNSEPAINVFRLTKR